MSFLRICIFDHCGGAIVWNTEKNMYEPTFPNAKFWSNKDHWDWAIKPNNREKASFLKKTFIQ